MKISVLTVSIATCAGVVAVLFAFHRSPSGGVAPAQDEMLRVRAAREESPEPGPAFEKTADTVTLGSGVVPPQTDPALEKFDRMMQRMAALPEGDEKVARAQEIGLIDDPAAVPVLLNWAVATPDRGVLRASLTALARLGSAATIEDIQRRYAATRSYDERYRLGKVIASLANPEAAPALMALADSSEAPPQLVVAAADALATLGTGPAVSLLLQKLEAEPPEESQRLQTTIARINRAEAFPALESAARGNKDAPSARGRVAAIQALANFPEPQISGLLQELSADPTKEVSEAARAVLGRTR